MVKNLPYNAGDADSIPGQETKIPHASELLSPRAATTELVRLNERARMPQTTEPTCPGSCAPQLEKRKPSCHNEREGCVLQRKDPTQPKINKTKIKEVVIIFK